MSAPIPQSAIAQHCIVLGKTGAGKSSVLRLLVEGLLERESPVCIVDPKGDWYGIKSSADGKHAGYPVVIFGGEHSDVPINEHSGAHVAELVACGNRPCLIDLGGWMVGERTRFFIAFAGAFFKHARGLRHLVIDEIHNFAPQGKVLDVDAGKMLHWANRLASEGRGKGITLLAASQRPQKVHKDFVTSCETLIAMRVIHPLDRNAIKEWVDGCADPEKGKQVIAELAGMKRGEAWVWSPEIEFGPKRVTFPLFKTFDSFKARAAPTKLQGWAEVDLEEVRTRLATVVAEAEANDPKKLKARIRELEAAMKKPPAPPAQATSTKVPGPDVARIRELRRRVELLERNNKALKEYGDAMFAAAAHVETVAEEIDGKYRELAAIRFPRQPKLADVPDLPRSNPIKSDQPLPVPPASPRPREAKPNGLSKAEFAFLRALWWLRDEERTPEKVAFYAGYSISSSSFGNNLGSLRSAGLVEKFGVTYAGEQVIAHVAGEKPTGRELREWVRPKLEKAENAFLDALIAARGAPVADEPLAAAAGYSLTSSSFGNSLGKLRSIGAAVGYGKDGGTRCADVFLEP